ncbi:hypothetical protein [Arthrobacter sp. ZGTC412]|uniref:hypothetical protein n=1 Tax=Arthrobacter sp. ZGTC412 TaxID=2058900 RepID=UPI0011AFDEE0|nr:hypothetical protein [Arthrobacter sp. ZGTC412]
MANDVVGALREKWVFIATSGMVNCLFRAPVGRTIDVGGKSIILDAISETEPAAAAAGHPVTEAGHGQAVGLLTGPGSAFTSSLYREAHDHQYPDR